MASRPLSDSAWPNNSLPHAAFCQVLLWIWFLPAFRTASRQFDIVRCQLFQLWHVRIKLWGRRLNKSLRNHTGQIFRSTEETNSLQNQYCNAVEKSNQCTWARAELNIPVNKCPDRIHYGAWFPLPCNITSHEEINCSPQGSAIIKHG